MGMHRLMLHLQEAAIPHLPLGSTGACTEDHSYLWVSPAMPHLCTPRPPPEILQYFEFGLEERVETCFPCLDVGFTRKKIKLVIVASGDRIYLLRC